MNTYNLLFILALVGLFPVRIYGQLSKDSKKVLEKMDAQAEHFEAISSQLWDFPELGYKETKSVKLLKSTLSEAGFAIQDVEGIPTAFVANYGQGKPVIGILGEYDALPGMSQQSIPERKPVIKDGPGHGCGHNLLGTASAFAAITVMDYMAEKNINGTIRFYGTPAEEGGSGKIFMLRKGVFDDCDVVLAWHPKSWNGAGWQNSLAIISAKFRFHGVSSHAAVAPDKGRSALDGLMLMTQAVEMLREHIPQESRIHFVITDGGKAPNVVPEFSELYIYVRHPEMGVVENIWKRVIKCGEGAALATETTTDYEVVGSAYDFLNNDPLNNLLQSNLLAIGGVKYSPEEEAFAEKIRSSLPEEALKELEDPEEILPVQLTSSSGSSDVGDVSWAFPTGHLWTATMVPNVPLHTWQATACSGSSIGRKGMVVAAKTLALTAMDLFSNPKWVDDAKKYFEQTRKGKQYKSMIPEGQGPPLNYRN